MELNLAKSQDERTQRAQEMLTENHVLIAASGPNQWTVQNGDKVPYQVSFIDIGTCSCTCVDFQRFKHVGVRCKHIEAVRLFQIQNPTTHILHKEASKMANENGNKESNYGLAKLYHPANGGVQVTLPLPTTGITEEEAMNMFNAFNTYLKVGFLLTQAGLEDGETREAVTHLARRAKVNTDQSVTPILDVYCGGNFKTVNLYLNKEEDVEAFNDAFGIGLKDLPLWEGDAAIERGKNPERDKKYIVAVSGVDVVYKKNEKYEGDDDKKHTKRVFARWERKVTAPKTSTATASIPAQTPSVPPTPPPATAPAPSAPAPVSAPETTSVRSYLDGNSVSANAAEQQAFDNYLKAHGNAPQSLQALRSAVSTAG